MKLIETKENKEITLHLKKVSVFVRFKPKTHKKGVKKGYSIPSFFPLLCPAAVMTSQHKERGDFRWCARILLYLLFRRTLVKRKAEKAKTD